MITTNLYLNIYEKLTKDQVSFHFSKHKHYVLVKIIIKTFTQVSELERYFCLR